MIYLCLCPAVLFSRVAPINGTEHEIDLLITSNVLNLSLDLYSCSFDQQMDEPPLIKLAVFVCIEKDYIVIVHSVVNGLLLVH